MTFAENFKYLARLNKVEDYAFLFGYFKEAEPVLHNLSFNKIKKLVDLVNQKFEFVDDAGETRTASVREETGRLGNLIVQRNLLELDRVFEILNNFKEKMYLQEKNIQALKHLDIESMSLESLKKRLAD